MARRRRRHLLVPEARAALDSLKAQVIEAKTAGQPSDAKVPAISPLNNMPPYGMQSIASGPAGPSLLSEYGSLRSPTPPVSWPALPSQGIGDMAKSMGIPYQPQGDNGNLTTRQAGRIGGQIGGTMVQRLISLAEHQLTQMDASNPVNFIPNERPAPQKPRA